MQKPLVVVILGSERGAVASIGILVFTVLGIVEVGLIGIIFVIAHTGIVVAAAVFLWRS